MKPNLEGVELSEKQLEMVTEGEIPLLSERAKAFLVGLSFLTYNTGKDLTS